MTISVTNRAKKRHEALRRAGLRPVQIWVPNTRRANFAAECRHQSKLATQADIADTELLNFMNSALTDIEGWTA